MSCQWLLRALVTGETGTGGQSRAEQDRAGQARRWALVMGVAARLSIDRAANRRRDGGKRPARTVCTVEALGKLQARWQGGLARRFETARRLHGAGQSSERAGSRVSSVQCPPWRNRKCEDAGSLAVKGRAGARQQTRPAAETAREGSMTESEQCRSWSWAGEGWFRHGRRTPAVRYG